MTIHSNDVGRANLDDVLPAIYVDSFAAPIVILFPPPLTSTRSQVPVSFNTELLMPTDAFGPLSQSWASPDTTEYDGSERDPLPHPITIAVVAINAIKTLFIFCPFDVITFSQSRLKTISPPAN